MPSSKIFKNTTNGSKNKKKRRVEPEPPPPIQWASYADVTEWSPFFACIASQDGACDQSLLEEIYLAEFPVEIYGLPGALQHADALVQTRKALATCRASKQPVTLHRSSYVNSFRAMSTAQFRQVLLSSSNAPKELYEAGKQVFNEREDEIKAFRVARAPTHYGNAIGKEDTGPEGETLATHNVCIEQVKCGGKGQTTRAVTWTKKQSGTCANSDEEDGEDYPYDDIREWVH